MRLTKIQLVRIQEQSRNVLIGKASLELSPRKSECAMKTLFEACCRNHMEIAELLLKHGANPNAGMDSCECCLTIGAVYHGDKAKPLQRLLRRHGAITPSYAK